MGTTSRESPASIRECTIDHKSDIATIGIKIYHEPIRAPAMRLADQARLPPREPRCRPPEFRRLCTYLACCERAVDVMPVSLVTCKIHSLHWTWILRFPAGVWDSPHKGRVVPVRLAMTRSNSCVFYCLQRRSKGKVI